MSLDCQQILHLGCEPLLRVEVHDEINPKDAHAYGKVGGVLSPIGGLKVVILAARGSYKYGAEFTPTLSHEFLDCCHFWRARNCWTEPVDSQPERDLGSV